MEAVIPETIRRGISRASAIARILYRGPGPARLLCSFCRPPQPRARGTPGVQEDPRASTPRDIEACRSPVCSPAALVRAKRQSMPQVRQTQGVPRAVFIGLLPSKPRWSLLIRVCPLGLHRDMSTERDPDRASPLLTGAGQTTVASGVPGAQQARWGSLAAWTAGPLHRISDARSCPGHRSPPRIWRR